MKNLVLLFAIVVLFAKTMNAQTSVDKFTFGVSLSSTLFNEESASKIGQRYNAQFPRFNFSGKLSESFSFDVALTFNVLGNIEGVINNKFEYTSLDGAIRFNPFRSDAMIVPYIGVGASYIGGASTVSSGDNALSLNVLGGGALWVSPKFGFIGQLTYKYVSEDATAMVSHIQTTIGIAYRFGSGSQSRSRLWD
ncbi:hypothetical protein [Polaribacter sp. Hel_I_88]|uniref:hypothetical protein n=1 Tax=Polaribacter sp. Hel_I_88 TaxID=1250006 RepID=UPI00047C3CD0|nr:hypothetical protein [Polaribacter sp. Hel_I_88]|tara:strand:- start:95 stop:676 length:582 start_codon:yes stop_codon:yes gene_type:complete